MYLNKTILYGNLTRDPELKALPSGSAVTNFSIATNRTWKDKDGSKKEAVEYHNVVAFGKTAELINQYMHKGSAIYVEGRLQTRSWEHDGAKRYTTEVIVENFQFGPKKDGATHEPKQEKDLMEQLAEQNAAMGDINPEDIPF